MPLKCPKCGKCHVRSMPCQTTVPLSGKATVDALADNWGKILAIIMAKLDITEVTVTTEDIDRVGKDGVLDKCLVVQELEDGLHIRLLPVEEAMRIARLPENKRGFSKS